MTDKPNLAFSRQEAEAFIRRFGLKSLGSGDLDAMAASMEKIATAGLAVTRVPSKFDQPAPVFRVPTPAR